MLVRRGDFQIMCFKSTFEVSVLPLVRLNCGKAADARLAHSNKYSTNLWLVSILITMQNFASSEKRYWVLTPRYKQRIVFFFAGIWPWAWHGSVAYWIHLCQSFQQRRRFIKISVIWNGLRKCLLSSKAARSYIAFMSSSWLLYVLRQSSYLITSASCLFKRTLSCVANKESSCFLFRQTGRTWLLETRP